METITMRKINFIAFFFLISCICFSKQFKEEWIYKFHEGQIISYSLNMQITNTIQKNKEKPIIISQHLIAQIIEKVEKKISTDSFQIWIMFELLKVNGEPPINYHPQCNRIQVKENGYLIKSEEAGYSWNIFDKSHSICSIIGPKSPNFGYCFPNDKIYNSEPYFERGFFQNLMMEAVVNVKPIIENDDLIKLDYNFTSASTSTTLNLLASGTGLILLSREKGLLIKNEGEIRSIMNFKASDSFQATIVSTFTLKIK